MPEQVMVAMSGGVDSSAAAALLLEQGYSVSGATMTLCTSLTADEAPDARSAADLLGIAHHVFHFEPAFRDLVINSFAASYLSGETPNPCIACNRHIKFGQLLDRARLLGANYIATGHYAKIRYDETTGRFLLEKAKDRSKDQSYVLYALTQDQLRHILFPLGDLTKAEVRDIARSRGLFNENKPESQDICFVPDGDYASFLQNTLHSPSCPGDFIDSEGKLLGKHKGLIHYTVGQRRGIGLSFERPKYVLKKDAKTNTVVLGNEEELYTDSMLVRDVNLISLKALTEPIEATVKTRYSQGETPATIYPDSDGRCRVVFRRPQRAITPGQAAVFYDHDTVIGGGAISS